MTEPISEPDWNAPGRLKAARVLGLVCGLLAFYLGFQMWNDLYVRGRLPEAGALLFLASVVAGGVLVGWRLRALRALAIAAGVTLAVLVVTSPVGCVVYYVVAGGAAR